MDALTLHNRRGMAQDTEVRGVPFVVLGGASIPQVAPIFAAPIFVAPIFVAPASRRLSGGRLAHLARAEARAKRRNYQHGTRNYQLSHKWPFGMVGVITCLRGYFRVARHPIPFFSSERSPDKFPQVRKQLQQASVTRIKKIWSLFRPDRRVPRRLFTIIVRFFTAHIDLHH